MTFWCWHLFRWMGNAVKFKRVCRPFLLINFWATPFANRVQPSSRSSPDSFASSFATKNSFLWNSFVIFLKSLSLKKSKESFWNPHYEKDIFFTLQFWSSLKVEFECKQRKKHFFLSPNGLFFILRFLNSKRKVFFSKVSFFILQCSFFILIDKVSSRENILILMEKEKLFL